MGNFNTFLHNLWVNSGANDRGQALANIYTFAN